MTPHPVTPHPAPAPVTPPWTMIMDSFDHIATETVRDHETVKPVHEVLRVLGERARAGSLPGERRDGYRVTLAIEGGGMRGTISAGMALALDELGLVSAFDAVYGASAGAITEIGRAHV